MTITAFQLKSKHFKPKLAESDITIQLLHFNLNPNTSNQNLQNLT